MNRRRSSTRRGKRRKKKRSLIFLSAKLLGMSKGTCQIGTVKSSPFRCATNIFITLRAKPGC